MIEIETYTELVDFIVEFIGRYAFSLTTLSNGEKLIFSNVNDRCLYAINLLRSDHISIWISFDIDLQSNYCSFDLISYLDLVCFDHIPINSWSDIALLAKRYWFFCI